jgi:DNA replication protein DnaC
MRSEFEIEEYKKRIETKQISETKKYFFIEAYEGCIPLDFWNIKKEEVEHNCEIFREVILKYCKKFKTTHRRGYGIILFGDNGEGKSFFLSYILTRAIKKGKTVYYTTLPQLDHNIKRGFRDHKIAERIEMMLTSDYLAIDEIGKEQKGDKKKIAPIYSDTQFERILKRRFDDGMPTLLGSNLNYEDLIGMYGSTVESVIKGKYTMAELNEGDYRAILATRMRKEMGIG